MYVTIVDNTPDRLHLRHDPRILRGFVLTLIGLSAWVLIFGGFWPFLEIRIWRIFGFLALIPLTLVLFVYLSRTEVIFDRATGLVSRYDRLWRWKWDYFIALHAIEGTTIRQLHGLDLKVLFRFADGVDPLKLPDGSDVPENLHGLHPDVEVDFNGITLVETWGARGHRKLAALIEAWLEQARGD